MTEPGATALLAPNGELPSTELIARLRLESSLLVAADGAGLRLLERGIGPDVVIGDLDSIGHAGNMFAASGSILIERPDQELNDFEKALRWLLGEGYIRVIVVGHAGGMVDHTLNNFSIVARYASGMELLLRDDRSSGYVIRDGIALAARPGERISLIPLPSARLTTVGLRWELSDEILAFGVREGASNEAIAAWISVTIAEGCVLLMQYPALDV